MHPAWDKTGRQQDFRTKAKNFYFKRSLIKADKLLCCLKMRTERGEEPQEWGEPRRRATVPCPPGTNTLRKFVRPPTAEEETKAPEAECLAQILPNCRAQVFAFHFALGRVANCSLLIRQASDTASGASVSVILLWEHRDYRYVLPCPVLCLKIQTQTCVANTSPTESISMPLLFGGR